MHASDDAFKRPMVREAGTRAEEMATPRLNKPTYSATTATAAAEIAIVQPIARDAVFGVQGEEHQPRYDSARRTYAAETNSLPALSCGA
jgi:hypothetical protein